MNKTLNYFSIVLILALSACEQKDSITVTLTDNQEQASAQNAVDFVAQAEKELEPALVQAGRVAWVYNNFITEDTAKLSASADKEYTAKQVELALQAAQFNDTEGLDADTKRKLNMLRSGITIPAPSDAEKTAEQSEIGAELSGMYGKGEYCYADGKCLDLGHLGDIMAESRDPDALLEAWEGWREVSVPMKSLYARQVELANEGAAELGFSAKI